ncbi:hypothetical protein C8R45DRAFT_500297 [Mycena sanguinolenta]|nr:hypothetical protein C8R45DRAFT_500297 [Mycena sanguinolenta]
MSNSQDAVLSTPELVELTLSHLPLRELFVTAPLVCKTWQALTLAPTLQRALFFESDLAYPPGAERVRNPLLMEMFAPFFAEISEDTYHRNWTYAKKLQSMPWAKSPAAFNRPEASWRRMLVAQPPPQIMLVREAVHERNGGGQVRYGVLDDGPLRMGMLYDVALPLIDRVRTSFCLRWSGSHDGEDHSASDVTLSVAFAPKFTSGDRRVLDLQFYSATSATEDKSAFKFGEWSELPDDE